MIKDVRHDGGFIATDDDGNEYVVNIFTNINDAGTFDNPNATSEGLKRLITNEGDDVNYLEKGKYKIVQSNIIIRSNEPDAP